MTANAFTKRWLLAISGLVLLGLAFPFIIGPLACATGCQQVGGACGAMALMLGVFLRLPFVIGVGLYIAILVTKRSNALQLKPWGLIFIVTSYLAAIPLLFGFGNFWAANFSLGVQTAGTLPAFGFLIVGLVGLSSLPDAIGNQKTSARGATLVFGGISLLLLLPHAVRGLTLVPILNWIAFPVSFVVTRSTAPLLRYVEPYLTLFALLAFVASLAWWIKGSNADQGASINPST